MGVGGGALQVRFRVSVLGGRRWVSHEGCVGRDFASPRYLERLGMVGWDGMMQCCSRVVGGRSETMRGGSFLAFEQTPWTRGMLRICIGYQDAFAAGLYIT